MIPVTGVTLEEPPSPLVIRAQEAYDGVAGDPRRYGPLAVDLVAEARRCADHEALVVALRAVAWFARAQRQNARALRVLGEAVQLASRPGMTHRLAEVLVTRAAIVMELGRSAAAVRDLNRAAQGDGAQSAGIEFMRAVLLHNIGRLQAAATSYRRVLADPAATLDNRGSAANNLALVVASFGHFDEPRHLQHAEQYVG